MNYLQKLDGWFGIYNQIMAKTSLFASSLTTEHPIILFLFKPKQPIISKDIFAKMENCSDPQELDTWQSESQEV